MDSAVAKTRFFGFAVGVSLVVFVAFVFFADGLRVAFGISGSGGLMRSPGDAGLSPKVNIIWSSSTLRRFVG